MKALAQVTGRLGKDVESKNIKEGRWVLELSVASDNTYRNSEGEKVEQTDWHDIKMFSNKEPSVDFVSLFKKGREITANGNLCYNEYTDKNESNQKRAYIDVRPGNIKVHGSRNSTSEQSASEGNEG